MKTSPILLAVFVSILFLGCKKDEDKNTEGVKPSVETLRTSNISPNSAIIHCKITSEGSSGVFTRGVCFNDIPNPTTSDQTTQSNYNDDEYSVNLYSLWPNKTYYVKAYATNGSGTAYGNEISFTTAAPSSPAVGSVGPGGGIVFYDKGYVTNGWRYLEVSDEDLDQEYIWGCLNSGIYTHAGIGYGQFNTQNFVNSCGTGAAARCHLLIRNGFSDWFLPSIDELNLIYQTVHLTGLGGFSSGVYWSSTEMQDPIGIKTHAQTIDFNNGYKSTFQKNIPLKVRPVRVFPSM